MAKVVDGQIEWLKDEVTGVPVGFKKKNGTEGGLATVDFNPVTGGIGLSASGRDVIASAITGIRESALYKPFGVGANSNTANAETRLMKLTAEADFDAVRIHYYHYGTTTPTVKFAVAVTETAETDTTAHLSQPVVGGTAYNTIDSASEAYGWKTAKFAGASTKTLAGSGGSVAPEIIVSDWIPLSSVPRGDGGSLPLIMVMGRPIDAATQTASWVNTGAGVSAMRTPSAANRGRIIQSMRSVTDLIAAPGTGTAPALINDSLPIAVEFRFRTAAVGVVFIGDSITQNNAIVPDFYTSWGYRACAIASTPGRPIVPCNMGASSQNSTTYLREALRVLALSGFKIAVYSAWSPNEGTYTSDGGTRLAIQGLAGRTAEFIAACRQYDIVPILWTGIPYSAGLTAARDAMRVAYNARLRAMADAGVCKVIDFDSIMSNGASPAVIVAGYNNGDNIHPSEAGIEAMAVLAAAEIAKI